jgi:hypothetical protein
VISLLFNLDEGSGRRAGQSLGEPEREITGWILWMLSNAAAADIGLTRSAEPG